MQCAALIIHFGSTNTAPHQCPRKPNDGCNNSSETCHGNCPSFVGEPSIIFGIRYFELILGCRRNGLTPHSLMGNKINFPCVGTVSIIICCDVYRRVSLLLCATRYNQNNNFQFIVKLVNIN